MNALIVDAVFRSFAMAVIVAFILGGLVVFGAMKGCDYASQYTVKIERKTAPEEGARDEE